MRRKSVSRHAYYRSPDGKTLIHDETQGIVVQRGEVTRRYPLKTLGIRDLHFSPKDPHLVASWAPRVEGRAPGVAILDLSRLDEKLALRVIYTQPDKTQLVDFRWAPQGEGIWILEKDADLKYAWKEVPLDDGAVSVLGSASESLQFMAPYIDPKTGESKLILADWEGLHLLQRGKSARQLSTFGPRHIVDRAASFARGRNHLAMAFKGGRLGAVTYLVDIERLVREADKGPATKDSPAFDLVVKGVPATLWFSPKTSYLTGITREYLFLRRTKSPRAEPTHIEFLDSQENLLRPRGAYWNDAETKLAVLVANELWVYDWTAPKLAKSDATWGLDQLQALTGKRPTLRRLATIRGGFLAEPQWQGERIVFSQFEDAKEEVERIRKKLKLPKDGK